jgi:hypothetical protein
MRGVRNLSERCTLAMGSVGVAILLLLLIAGTASARLASAPAGTVVADGSYAITGLTWGSDSLAPAFKRTPPLYKQHAVVQVQYALIIEAQDADGNPVSLSSVPCTVQLRLYRDGVLKERASVAATANLPSGYVNTMTFTCNAKPGWYVIKLRAIHTPSGQQTRSIGLRFKIRK